MLGLALLVIEALEVEGRELALVLAVEPEPWEEALECYANRSFLG